ncbi:methyltransferase domain-containing protein [Streptomyces lunaelactis]|uniref:methyltransferase domain-containing protein n=1 Tax=Streptomyces lunaelactis TaxID=1535768 RepID=UPI00158544B9|nr:methyltransferase domain-containing protein [Streptomyces lunaelactis]
MGGGRPQLPHAHRHRAGAVHTPLPHTLRSRRRDVGCGNGIFSRQLHRFSCDVTGLDFADTALHGACLL